MKIELMNIDELKAHEQVYPRYLNVLREAIREDGLVKHPVIVDQESYVVLDGSHRHIALLQLGCIKVPALLVNYFSPHISVGSRRKHQFRVEDGQPIPLSKGAVLYAGLTGKLMMPRSSRHYFKFNKLIPINVSLVEIGFRTPPDVSSHIAKYTLEEEINDLNGYVEECNEDLIILDEMKSEVIETKNDQQKRLIKLKELKL